MQCFSEWNPWIATGGGGGGMRFTEGKSNQNTFELDRSKSQPQKHWKLLKRKATGCKS